MSQIRYITDERIHANATLCQFKLIYGGRFYKDIDSDLFLRIEVPDDVVIKDSKTFDTTPLRELNPEIIVKFKDEFIVDSMLTDIFINGEAHYKDLVKIVKYKCTHSKKYGYVPKDAFSRNAKHPVDINPNEYPCFASPSMYDATACDGCKYNEICYEQFRDYLK